MGVGETIFDLIGSFALKSSLITRKVRNYFAKNQE